MEQKKEMVIGEALNKIKDMEAEKQRLTGLLSSSVFVLPDNPEKMPSPTALLAQISTIMYDIATLKKKLVKTNSLLCVDVNGKSYTLFELMKTIEIKNNQQSALSAIATSLTSRSDRFLRQGYNETPLQLQVNTDMTAEQFRELAKTAKDEYRQLQQALTKANWTITLME